MTKNSFVAEVTFNDTKPYSSVSKRFWAHILEEHPISYPNLADLILIIIAISPGTGPLERSFSKLTKICYKDRGCISSTVLETLYLLSTLSINEKDDALFQKAREFLQKKWLYIILTFFKFYFIDIFTVCWYFILILGSYMEF